jgi:O-antigen/teichoic acid export membrane protein
MEKIDKKYRILTTITLSLFFFFFCYSLLYIEDDITAVILMIAYAIISYGIMTIIENWKKEKIDKL